MKPNPIARITERDFSGFSCRGSLGVRFRGLSAIDMRFVARNIRSKRYVFGTCAQKATETEVLMKSDSR
jgi:hypothetical protein